MATAKIILNFEFLTFNSSKFVQAIKIILLLALPAWTSSALGAEPAKESELKNFARSAGLRAAIKAGNLERARTLLEANPELVDASDFSGATLLHLAVAANNTAMMELLLAKKAQASAADKEGNTPLHWAAERGNKAAAELLIAHQADLRVKNKEGFKPLELVTGKARGQFADLLLKHGAAGLDASGLVSLGPLGDPSRLVFEGNKTFPAEVIRRGLMLNSEFLLASHPAGRFEDFLQVLREKVLAGYQSGGFPDAQVTTRLNEKDAMIMVGVMEGPRYRRGDVKVSGAKTIPVETFIRRLTEPFPPPAPVFFLMIARARGLSPIGAAKPGLTPERDDAEWEKFKARRVDGTGKEIKTEDPIWEKGEPAPFAEVSIRELKRTITAVLSEYGRFFPKVEVKVLPDPNTGTAALLVDISDEGPEGLVAEIELTGHKKNGREQVLKYLGLKPGMRLTRDLVTHTELRLWRSARFLRYQVMPLVLEDKPSSLNLRLELVENEKAPSLGKDFSTVEKVHLKLGEWLSDFPSRKEDLVAVIAGATLPGWEDKQLEVMLSPEQGVLFLIKTNQQDFCNAVLLSPEISGLYSPARRQKLLVTRALLQAIAFVRFLPSPAGSEQPFNLSLGGGAKGMLFKQEKKTAQRPFDLEMLLAPAAMVHMAHQDETKYSMQSKVLLVSSEESRLRIDRQSGRLLEWNFSEANGPGRGSVRFEEGAFERARQQIEAGTALHANGLRTNKPLSSFVGYVADEIVQSPLFDKWLFKNVPLEKRVRAAAALHKVFTAQALAPLDKLAAESSIEEADSFAVPIPRPESASAPNQALFSFISAFVFKYSNDLFPKRSWPWTIAREAVFVLGGNDKYTQKELEKIYEGEETGPLGYLAVAKLMSLLKMPASSAFAERGQRRLANADFRKDWRLVFEGDSVLAKTAETMLVAFRDLNEDEIEALGDALPPETGDLVRKTARLLREKNGASAREVMPSILDELWDRILAKPVELELRKLAAARSK